MARIVIVEDDELQSELIRRYLERERHEVRIIGDGAAALTAIRASSPDLLILDVMLPGLDGFTVCRTLREEMRELPILILTARSTENDLLLGLELGADDYLTKPYSPRELVGRVRALLRRILPPPTPSPDVVVGDLRMDPQRRTVRVGTQPVDLTRAEFDLLLILASQPGIVLSRSQLLDHLHGSARWIGQRTIDTHVKNLRLKIEHDPQRPNTLVTVHGVGYKLAPPEA